VKPWLCPKGHDKNVLGAHSDGRCSECRKAYDQSRYALRKGVTFINPICKYGHDKRIVGSRSGGACAECHRIKNRAYWRKRRREEAKTNSYSILEARALPSLRTTRRRLGLSVRELSRLTGLSLTVLYKIETGATKARPYALRRILPVIAQKIREERWENVA
jgi:hypothetical protein